jgi:hypothetical protein
MSQGRREKLSDAGRSNYLVSSIGVGGTREDGESLSVKPTPARTWKEMTADLLLLTMAPMESIWRQEV